jgi:hypothetical protein
MAWLHDALNQLTGDVRTGAADYSYPYTYDGVGNRLSKESRVNRLLLTLPLLVVLLSGCPSREAATPVPKPSAEPQKAAVSEATPTYACARVSGEITVDGSLDEAAWQAAEVVGPFVQWQGEPAKSKTTARLLWDDANLYVAFECEDSDIQGAMKERDESLWEENEVVELFADAGHDGGCYLEFEVNPLNTVVDLVIPQAGAPGPIEAKKMWDAEGMETAVQVERPGESDGSWTVEMGIPLICFLEAPNTPPRPGDYWRINLYRVDAVSDQVEYQAWSPTNTDEPAFHVPDRFGVLRFEGEGGGEAGKS